MSEAWYYFDNEEQIGPITLQELKEKLPRLSGPENVLVWRNGFTDWVRAGDVPELRAQMSETLDLAEGSWFARLMRRRATVKAGALYLVVLALTLIASTYDVINILTPFPGLSNALVGVTVVVLFVPAMAAVSCVVIWLFLLLFRWAGRRFDGASSSRGTWLKKEITVTFGGIALTFGVLAAILFACFLISSIVFVLSGPSLGALSIWHWLVLLIFLALNIVANWLLVLLVQFVGRFVFK